MPENDDMAALVAELSPQEPNAPVAPEPSEATAEPVTEDPVVEVKEDIQEQGDEPPAKQAPVAKDKAGDSSQAKAFAEMRVKNTQYERALKRAAEVEGLSVDDYLKKIEDGALTKRAEQMQTNPDVLRRLEEAEAKLQEQEQSKAQMHLAMEFQKLQHDLGVSDEELSTFTQELAQRGFNFLDPTANYTALYRGLNFDKLVEKERQSWIVRSQKATQQGSQPIAKNGKNGASGPDTVETMRDLDALLESLKD